MAGPDRDRRPAHAVLNAAFLAAFLAGGVALRALDVSPATGRVVLPFGGGDLPDSCRLLAATGRPCPSCGATRAVILALRGDAAASLAYHPAGVPVAVMLLVQVAMRAAFLWRRSVALDLVVSGAMLAAFAVLVNSR